MDPTNYMSMGFHFNGEFIQEGRAVYYVGGKEEMSYLERDRLSMDELWQQVQVHYLVVEGQQLHWLFPGKELHEGLMMLYEENAGTMSKHATDCGVVDIYVEDPAVDDKEASEWEVEEENCGADEQNYCGDDVPAADSEEENVEGGENS
jgi:alpha-galactosidase